MDRAYWEEKGRAHETEIFDAYAEDRSGVLARRLRQIARRHSGGRAADLGCGTGKAIPRLAALYSEVEGIDLSASCIAAARSALGERPGVTLRRGNLARRLAIRPADFVLCVHVLIMPDERTRACVGRILARTLKPGGHALVAVPSLESALWSARNLYEWERRDGQSPPAARRSIARLLPGLGSPALAEGILPIDGVPTKHYLQEEFAPLARSWGLRLERVERIPYAWSSEFRHPPGWMQDARPWDWLAVFYKPLPVNN